MRKRAMGSLALGALCLALVAFAFFSRKPLCIDSKLVERIDRVGEQGTASMYRCGLYRQVKYNPKLVEDSQQLKPRLQKLETFLSLVGMPNERLNLTIIEGKDSLFRLQGRQIFVSEDVLNEPYSLEKAVLKAWYRERVPQPLFGFLFAEESVTDLMLFAATGKLMVEDATDRWPQALMVDGEYCSSPWRILDDVGSCAKKANSRVVVVESLRGLAAQSLINAYLRLNPQEQFHALMSLSHRVSELQFVRSEKKSQDKADDTQETLADAARFLNEWREFVIRIFPDYARAKVALNLQQELYNRGFTDSFLASYFDWAIELREQDKEIFQQLHKLSKQPQAPTVAVQVGEWVWMLPNQKPVPAKSFESLRAYRGLTIGCGKPDIKSLEAWGHRVQHLTAIDDCGSKLEILTQSLFANDILEFARTNPNIRFMQVHLPSVELSIKKGASPLAVGQLRYHDKANVYQSLLPVAPVTWYRP